MEQKKEAVCCECHKRKHREAKEYKDLITRLNRIEGQVRGIRGMVENECYCVDILTQVSAVQSALNSFNKKLLENHIKTCVVEDIKAGKEEVIDELLNTLRKIMK
ncbi:MAG: metal-sensing transcriptional repressor [Acetivibrio ethanolgignens]